MADHSKNFIRVRLHFDYPPPAVVDCRMCWLLVDMNTCRVVADLESVIREKFEFSRRSIVSLFIEDCYLPHTESVHVVRDNDSLRVKVDYLSQVNGNSSCPEKAENCRKRQRPIEEEEPGENGVSLEWKKKKRKKGSEEREAKWLSGDERDKKSQGKCTEKKKRKKVEETVPAATPNPATSTKTTPVRVDQPGKRSKMPTLAQAKTQNTPSSPYRSCCSEEDEVTKKTAAQKSAPKTPSSTPASSKAHPTTKPTQAKPQNPPLSSSSETSSSSNEATSVNVPRKDKTLASTTPKGHNNSRSQQCPLAAESSNRAKKQTASMMLTPHGNISKSCTSSSEDEIEFIIRQPMCQRGSGGDVHLPWRGNGRGNGRSGLDGTGRGGGIGMVRGPNASFEFSYNEAKEPSCQTESLRNMSVVHQNTAACAPKQDYSSMPLLAAPPQLGQMIAFKLLELTENYTPEVSEYKEGKILSFDHSTKQIELELQNASQAPVEPGKFDLVYQNPDGSERVEYAVSRDSRVTERWDSLLEPRLII